MTCKDCGHAIRINVMFENRLQAATDMLKHMAGHNASRAFAKAARVLEPNLAASVASDDSVVAAVEAPAEIEAQAGPSALEN